MTAVINESCESITIDSTNFAVDNQSVTLYLKYNCTKEYVVDISTALTEYVILPASVEMTDFMSDGIYGLTLKIVQEDGTVINETLCKVVDCVSSCTLVESFKNIGYSCSECLIQALAFNALKVAEDCTTCDCQTLCTLYDTVYPKDCKTITTNASTCGCS